MLPLPEFKTEPSLWLLDVVFPGFHICIYIYFLSTPISREKVSISQF